MSIEKQCYEYALKNKTFLENDIPITEYPNEWKIAVEVALREVKNPNDITDVYIRAEEVYLYHSGLLEE